MCEKADLVKYIEELKEQVEELEEKVERCEEETIPKEFLTDYLEQAGLVAIDDSLIEKFEGYKKELDELKKCNTDKSLNALYYLHPQIKDIVDENNELKKQLDITE
jgi:hypothetical protein